MDEKKNKKENPEWLRFERAVDIALRTPAKHKAVIRKKKKKSASKADA